MQNCQSIERKIQYSFFYHMLHTLAGDYVELMGKEIPFKKLSYPTLDALVKTVSVSSPEDTTQGAIFEFLRKLSYHDVLCLSVFVLFYSFCGPTIGPDFLKILWC